MMDSMLESDVESKLHRGVIALGGISYKWAPTTKGLPDRIVFLPGGRVFFIELKQTKGRVSPAQRAIHAKLAKRGTEVLIISGPDEVAEWLNQQKGPK